MRVHLLAPALGGLLLTAQAVETPLPKPAAAVPAAPVAAPPPSEPALTKPKLDSGLLDPAWFGSEVAFSKSDDVDFFWIKPGLDITGKVIHMVAWDDPAMLKPGRDGKDNAKATALTDSFPGMLRGAMAGALSGKAKVSRTEGDLLLIGRIVDANAGSKAAKWLVGYGAGSETATWDLKIVDTRTKEVLLAVHHRAISGTYMSTIDDKLIKWAEKFGHFLATAALK